eukprot:4225185-Prorocentrum_lima.AAC.1
MCIRDRLRAKLKVQWLLTYVLTEMIAQDLDHRLDVVMPVRRNRRFRSAIEPNLGFGAVQAQSRSHPRSRHGVKRELHLAEGEDEVEVVDVRHDGHLNPLPTARLSTKAGYGWSGG